MEEIHFFLFPKTQLKTLYITYKTNKKVLEDTIHRRWPLASNSPGLGIEVLRMEIPGAADKENSAKPCCLWSQIQERRVLAGETTRRQ